MDSERPQDTAPQRAGEVIEGTPDKSLPVRREGGPPPTRSTKPTPTEVEDKAETIVYPKGWVEQVETFTVIGLRDRAATFLFRTYAALITVTMGIFLLQGFHLWGFNLDLSLLKWLGGAVVGEIAGLALMVFSFLFERGNKRKRPSRTRNHARDAE